MRFCFFLLCVPFVATAQVVPESQRLSLVEAESLWRQHSREVRLAATEVDGSAGDVKTASQIPNPQASMNLLSISPGTGYGAGGWKDKKMDTQLRVDQIIERGDKRALRVRGAEARLNAARSDYEDTVRTQLLALTSAYYDLLLAQEKHRLAAEAAELYTRSHEAAKLRLRAGDIAPVELSRLQIEKARADNEARQAQAELENAQVALAYFVGRESNPRSLIATDAWPPLENRQIARADPAMRPDVVAARQRLQAAEAARDLARAQKTRDVTVGLQLERNLQNAPTNSFGIGISVPLFLWHSYEGDIARAEADYSAARLQLERVLALGQGEMDQAASGFLAAQARSQRLEQGLLGDAEKVAKAAEFAYTKGAMGVMDLLDARRTLRQVQMEALTARAEYAKARAAWKLQAEYDKK